MRTLPVLRNLLLPTLLALVLLLDISGRALAAGDTVEDLISKGVELRRRGQHERALELFRRAHAEDPSPRTLAQMGLAEQSLKRWIDSETHLIGALEDQSHPWIRKNRAHLQNALEAVRSHIGHLTVQGTPGAAVFVQGEARGTLPLAAPLRFGEGEVSVQVTAAGHQAFVRSVAIRPGEVTTIDARLEPANLAPERSSPPPTTPMPLRPTVKPDEAPGSQWTTGKTIGVTLIGAGVAAVGAGATLLLIDKNGTCSAPAPDAMCAQRRGTRVPGWTLVGAGIAAGALGGILLLTAGNSNTQVAISASPSSVFVSGRF